MPLIARMSVANNKRVVASLRPPLASFGYFSPVLAPRGIEPRTSRAFVVKLSFSLDFTCKGQHASIELSADRGSTAQQKGNCCSVQTNYQVEAPY